MKDRKISHYYLDLKFSGNVSWTSSSFHEEQSLICPFRYSTPSSQMMRHFTTEFITKGADIINHEDKSALFAGFISKSLHNLIKRLRPKTYKEDLLELRFALLKANWKVWEWSVKIKKLFYDICDRTKMKSPSKKRLTQTHQKFARQKTITSTVNIHSQHQDRKKRRKIQAKH
jgi:hypothetical protein